jgi:GMP synthase-like glutamine amidotransferase
MRAHYLQHVPFEGLGIIEPWLKIEGYEITSTRFYESTLLPDWSEVDLLLVMGGPMSVNDELEFPWLVEEKRFIRSCVEREKSVLGICLGAQLIASSMGGRVYPNFVKEIGWFPVEGIPEPGGRTFCFPPLLEVFHWHGETFDMPNGAYHLARSEGCENQAFQLGSSVIGIQFHLESSPESVQEIVSRCRAELTPSKYVQSESVILGATPEKYEAINKLMVKILHYLRNTVVSLPIE